MAKISNVKFIEIPRIEDYRGNLAVVEKEVLGSQVKRSYFVYDVPSSATRGGHSHKHQVETLFAISGSFEVVLHDGQEKNRIF